MTVVKSGPAWNALLARINAGLDALAESETRSITVSQIPDLANATQRQRNIIIATMARLASDAGWLLEKDFKNGELLLRLV